MNWWMEFAQASWSVNLELAPWLLFGTALSCLMHRFIPTHWIQSQLQGKLGVLKSVVFGIPLPLCSCSVIPTGLGLRKQGSSDGATVGFLIATPQTGVDSIIVSANFLGWPFAIFKVVAALITGLIGGLLVKDSDTNSKIQASCSANDGGHKQSWKEAAVHGLDLLRSIWGWLVFGVLLSALITVSLPPDGLGVWINEYAGGPIGASLVALLISIPLYVCATASVPIAAALVHGGLPLGAALVFLMAGPATNVATIGAVRTELGNRTTLIYLSTVVFGSLILGSTFDFLLEVPAVKVTGHEHATWWAQVSAIFLTGLCLFYVWEEIQLRLSSVDIQNSKTFTVNGMTCNGCVNRLRNLLDQTDGIDNVQVVLEPGSAIVETSLPDHDIITIIHDAGFTVPNRGL